MIMIKRRDPFEVRKTKMAPTTDTFIRPVYTK